MSEVLPYELVNPTGNPNLLILCDHASSALPEKYGTLGLPASEFHRHIAYDIGCAEVTRALAAHLDCPALLGRYSRLLVDLNRGPDDPTIVMKLSDGAIIPANANVDPFDKAAEFDHRIGAFHQPYHDAVIGQIKAAMDTGAGAPVVLSIHSFTPFWRGTARSWHTGILWDKDPRLAVPLMDALGQVGDLIVGDNKPYGTIKGDTMYRHCTLQGLPHALLEIRQDLIDSPEGQFSWVQRLVELLPPLIAAEGMREVRHFGSWTDRDHKI